MSKFEFKTFEDIEFEGAWRSETRDIDSGEIFIALFSGPDSERRAHEYTAFVSGKHPIAKPVVPEPPPVQTDLPIQDALELTLQNGDEISSRISNFLWNINPRCKGGFTATPKPAFVRRSKKGKA